MGCVPRPLLARSRRRDSKHGLPMKLDESVGGRGSFPTRLRGDCGRNGSKLRQGFTGILFCSLGLQAELHGVVSEDNSRPESAFLAR